MNKYDLDFKDLLGILGIKALDFDSIKSDLLAELEKIKNALTSEKYRNIGKGGSDIKRMEIRKSFNDKISQITTMIDDVKKNKDFFSILHAFIRLKINYLQTTDIEESRRKRSSFAKNNRG